MKTCSVCGLHVEDDYLYCWEDGTRLNETDAFVAPSPPTPETLENERMAAAPREIEGAEGQSVLYCPVCTGVFPLTFVACPIHHLPLTTKAFKRRPTREIRSAPTVATVATVATVEAAPEIPVEIAEPAVEFTPLATDRLDESTTEILSADEIEIEETSNPGKSRFQSIAVWSNEFRDRAKHFWEQLTSNRNAPKRHGKSPDWSFGFAGSEQPDPRNVPKGMRVAARATALALILITLVGVYLIYSLVTRRPSQSSRVGQPESPLIATPKEAREYRAESEPAPPPAIEQEGSERTTQGSQFGDARLDATPRTSLAGPARSGLANLAASSLESRPINVGGRFSTRLVRVRSYRSTSGYRYTLTFTLYEQAGRPMQWERLSIVTHSANGSTHSETLPFQYLLAGSGALTFTVNVEMAGSSEEDWRGRVSCTSVGADDSGRPLRASFGANLTP